MHTGSIIDFYDDPNGFVLKTKVAAEQMPEFIKTAQYLEDASRDGLPDDVFALVMVDRGEKLRKYACVDKGNTALSVIYFLENKDRLPEEAQKVAAANLLTACNWYDLQPPAPLMKTAGLFNKAWGALAMKDSISRGAARHKKVMKAIPPIPKVGELDAAPLDEEEKVAHQRFALVKEARAVISDDYRKRSDAWTDEMNSPKNINAFNKGLNIQAKKLYGKKLGNLSNKEWDGAYQAVRRDPWARKIHKKHFGFETPEEMGAYMKANVKFASMDPYVDVTGKEPPPRIEKVAHQRFALVKEGQGRFPIDSYGDVLEADRWFNDHGESLHPEDRRELCTKLAARADEIGCKVTDYVRKYAGVGYAPDGEIRVAVSTRMQYFQDDSPERDMLNGLMDKYAHVSPDVFCEAVKQFDEATGLDYHWDDGVYDPWYTTYGFVKEAAWEFSTHGDKINEEQLKQVVNASYPLIKEKFGEDMADSLKKSPVQIFDSLPLDTKRIIMRMANDPQPSPALVLS